MIRCPGCGATLADGRTSCPHCGARLNAGRTAEIEGDVAAALAALSIELGAPQRPDRAADRVPTQVGAVAPQTLFGRRGAQASADADMPLPVLEARDAAVPETVVLGRGRPLGPSGSDIGMPSSDDDSLGFEGTAFGIGTRQDEGGFGLVSTPRPVAHDELDSSTGPDWMEDLARSFDEDSNFESAPPIPGGLNRFADSAIGRDRSAGYRSSPGGSTAVPAHVDAFESTDPGFGLEGGAGAAAVRSGGYAAVPSAPEMSAAVLRRRVKRPDDATVERRAAPRRDPRVELDEPAQRSEKVESEQGRRTLREQFRQGDDRTHDRSPARQIARRGVAPGEAAPDAAWDFVPAESIPGGAASAPTAVQSEGARDVASDAALLESLGFAGGAAAPSPESAFVAADIPAAFRPAAPQVPVRSARRSLPPIKLVVGAVVAVIVLAAIALALLLTQA